MEPVLVYSDITSLSTLLTIITAFVALWLLSFVLGWYDRKIGIKWKNEVWGTIKGDPLALAIYFGARFVGCCLLIGQLVR